jgi:lipoic acid synthetase
VKTISETETAGKKIEDRSTAGKPPWLKVNLPQDSNFFSLSSVLKKHNLNTICRSARCPNIGECWSKKTAAFLILGDTCTRACRFCAVRKGTPLPPDEDEPDELAKVVTELGLAYAVVTSVTRDDLDDGGARHFARTIRAIRSASPGIRIEALIPDFKGDASALEIVLEARPDVLNHNLETTAALYPLINRAPRNYGRSLDVLAMAAAKGAVTKSGLMLGLGETQEEILESFSDLRRAGCLLLTLGQYLQPTPLNSPVEKYYPPREFEQLRNIALDFGFRDVAAGPLVRSSYFAERLYRAAVGEH